MITPEDLIIEMMPFSKGLKKFCIKNPEFSKALKIIYFARFIALQAVITSYSPNYPEDEVIGIFIYDYGIKNPQFKQDFIVNKGKKDSDFVLYTGLSEVVNNTTVKHINEFLATYGKGGYYKNTHRPKLEHFPPELKERALWAIKLAEKRKKDGFVEITPEFAQEIYDRLKELNKI